MLMISTRECRVCHTEKPITEFGSRGGKFPHLRRHECKACRAADTRARAAVKRWKRDDDAIYDFSRRVRDERSDRRVEQLCDRMLAKYGGAEQFLAVWFEHVNRLMTVAPTSARACAAYSATLRLMQWLADREAKEPPPKPVSREELERRRRKLLKQLADEISTRNPDVLAARLRGFGWTCIPPAD